MQNLVSIYELNAKLIKKFISSSLQRVGLKEVTPASTKQFFKTFPSLELIYECDEGFTQISPNQYPDHLDTSQIGKDRSYLLNAEDLDSEFFVSEPYLSTTTGHLCITVVYQTPRGYIFLDFKVRGLLERFDLIEQNTGFRRLNRFSYGIIGGGLIFFGLFVVVYAFFTFGGYILGEADLTLDVVFKPVIALTLGLAVFDLGKTIFEQEVLPKTQHVSESFNPKTLLNFSTSIIIALLIEALLVVFKISITDYRDLPFAAWLIAALSLLLFVFAVFIYLVRKSSSREGS